MRVQGITCQNYIVLGMSQHATNFETGVFNTTLLTRQVAKEEPPFTSMLKHCMSSRCLVLNSGRYSSLNHEEEVLSLRFGVSRDGSHFVNCCTNCTCQHDIASSSGDGRPFTQEMSRSQQKYDLFSIRIALTILYLPVI